ncbi:MAG: cell division protein ZipA C-terminal FtsZ-binding domain-containing protein [Methylococcaceae bacterium]
MEKEVVRIGIIAIGIIIVVGMYIRSKYKAKHYLDEYDTIHEDDYNMADEEVIDYSEDDFDLDLGEEPSSPKQQHKVSPDDGFSAIDESASENRSSASESTVIPFSIVARSDQGFSGNELIRAFGTVGLKYGTMDIFHRMDEDGESLYSTASMVEPGTFPIHDMESFSAPGIVFLFQPAGTFNASEVFDDFLETIGQLSKVLDGEVWDHQRQPLTQETVAVIRKQLRAAGS